MSRNLPKGKRWIAPKAKRPLAVQNGKLYPDPVLEESVRRAAPCKGCIHLKQFTTGTYACEYILDVGRRRPCPPGEGCTVKTTGKKKRRRPRC